MRLLLLLVFFQAVFLTEGQLSLVKNQDCKENESFQTCGTACKPSCETPSPSFCTLQCVVGCQCDKGFVRNANKACVTVENCSSTNVSIHSPGNSEHISLNCSANEVESDCHNPCTEKKCPTATPVMVNCLMMCQRGCTCKEGYVRNNQGQCVQEMMCPQDNATNSSENLCNLVDCRTGTNCIVRNGQAACVPTPRENSITCANVRCGSRGGCVMVEPAGCNKDCMMQPQCVEVNACSSMRCNNTEECVHVQAVCVRSPCDPIAECRPRQKPVAIGNQYMRKTRLASLDINFPSCMTARCGTPGGCAMVKPSHCVPGNCKLQPMCLNQNACAFTSCLVGSDCVLQQVTCIRAPCDPIAKCEPRSGNKKCGKNELYSDCVTSCSDKLCNVEQNYCSQECTKQGCVCRDGFFRNAHGSCVTQNDCDTEKQ